MRVHQWRCEHGSAGARIDCELDRDGGLVRDDHLSRNLRIVMTPELSGIACSMTRVMIGQRIVEADDAVFIVDFHHEVLQHVVAQVSVESTSDEWPEASHGNTF